MLYTYCAYATTAEIQEYVQTDHRRLVWWCTDSKACNCNTLRSIMPMQRSQVAGEWTGPWIMTRHSPATYRHQWLAGGQFSHTRNTKLNTLVKPETGPA